MKSRIFAICAATALSFLGIGCSFDAMTIVDHPGTVSEGQQFEVTLYNQFQHVTNGGTIAMDVIRDSLHVAVGFRAGWTVESAKYYVARDWDIVALASKLDDTVAMALAIRDSAAAFKARASAMTADASFAAGLAGRSYQANDKYGDNTILVETDSIESWSCFRGFTNILYTRGTPVDTMAIDTAGDTTGVSVMPVFAWVTLRAPSSARQDTLLYFSKTAAMPDDSESIDVGEIAYAAIRVGAASVRSSPTASHARDIAIRTRPHSGEVVIDLGDRARETIALSVYTLSGALVADLSPHLNRSSRAVTWNTRGMELKQGMYLLRIKTTCGVVSKQIQVMR